MSYTCKLKFRKNKKYTQISGLSHFIDLKEHIYSMDCKLQALEFNYFNFGWGPIHFPGHSINFSIYSGPSKYSHTFFQFSDVPPVAAPW